MRLATVVGSALVASLAIAGALTSVILAAGPGPAVNEFLILLVVTAYAGVGALVGLAQPSHPVGRLMLFGACVWGVGEALLTLAVRELARGEQILAGWLGAVGSLRGLGWLVLVVVVPLVFLDGRTPWGGRRPMVLALTSIGLFATASLLAPRPLDYRLNAVDSPTGVPASLAPLADGL